MGELLQGGRPLIEDTEGMTMMEIVVQEILQDKITIEGLPAGDAASQQGGESQGQESPKSGKTKTKN